MKPERAPSRAPSQPARVEFTVHFSPARPTAPRVPTATPPPESTPPPRTLGRKWGVVPSERPSKIALFLALAHHWARLVREGNVRNYAEIARLVGLTRARVTQIMNLTLLAPDIQEGILLKSCPEPDWQVREHDARMLSQIPAWNQQRKRWTTSQSSP